MKISEILDPFRKNADVAETILAIMGFTKRLNLTIQDIIERCRQNPTGLNQDIARLAIEQDLKLISEISTILTKVPGTDETLQNLQIRKQSLIKNKESLNLE